MANFQKTALIILDGWGISQDPQVSAIDQADTPVYDALIANCPHNVLVTYGEDVGLPEGQMGNSEVGHMNIGAGRVVYQELARINKAMREKELLQNAVFLAALEHARSTNRKIHLLGLVSDGGVHAHISHLLDLCSLLSEYPEIQVNIHAFLDGRDTDPKSGKEYLKHLLNHIENTNARLASVVGRYYAMDRDKRWERVKLAYDMLVKGVGELTDDFLEHIQASYDAGVTDEFVRPIISVDYKEKHMLIEEGDTVIFFNFRTDRPRQLTEVLTQSDMPEFDMHKLSLYYVTFTNYDQTYNNIHVVFEKDNVTRTLGQVISESGGTQVRIAETEKYPHVTFFFNGGQEEPFPGEDRILVPSPKVATYDMKPEMSAEEVTDKLIAHVEQKLPDFICLNYANADMVGHTGDFKAAMKAAEAVDQCLGRLLKVLEEYHYTSLVIADHGNSDLMINADGSPNTAHTTNLVPVILVNHDPNVFKEISGGKLGDVAPTILKIMGISKPLEMTGTSLL
jgi:2,3-bisphosphoglycerate-independent phosphoglycerate mutase